MSKRKANVRAIVRRAIDTMVQREVDAIAKKLVQDVLSSRPELRERMGQLIEKELDTLLNKPDRKK